MECEALVTSSRQGVAHGYCEAGTNPVFVWYQAFDKPIWRQEINPSANTIDGAEVGAEEQGDMAAVPS